MIYLDTSILISLVVPEPESESVERWFVGHRSKGMTISDWSLVEFASALGVRVRQKGLKQGQAVKAQERLGATASECFTTVSPSRAAYVRAAELCSHHFTGLRAGDALHLAVALDEGASSLVTLDRQMVAAVRSLQLPIEVIRPV
jgi:uncharacterized protein